MANTKFAAVKDDSKLWMIQPYGVVLGKEYGEYESALTAQLALILRDDPSYESADDATRLEAAKQMVADDHANGTQDFTNDAFIYKAPSVSDASIGGNDAINPLAAFNVDDDIVHQVFRTKSGHTFGMGRCYSEIYDSKQQILYLTMGVAKYQNLWTWLKNACHQEMVDANESGFVKAFDSIGNLIVGGIKLAFELPWLPILWASKFFQSTKDYPVTEYFLFRDSMPLYYRYVNSMLSEIAVAMGIYGNGSATNSGTSTDPERANRNSGTRADGANISQEMRRLYADNTPAVLKDGPDILKIMMRRSERMGGFEDTTDGLLSNEHEAVPPEDMKIGQYTGSFWSGFQTGALMGANFLGFRIEKAGQASETFGNILEDSQIAGKLNGIVNQKRSIEAGEAAGGDWVSGFRSFTKKMKYGASTLMDSLSNGDIETAVGYLAASNGYYDLPKQWKSANGIGRSLNFSLKLRAKTGGDNVSIFQSIMVPLSCILCASLPRATGDASYGSPFLIRAFCKGMFSIPAGIVSQLSVSRGDSEFGWSLNRLPTVVDVNFTIEDLSPMLFLNLAATGVTSMFAQAFSNNTKLHEYLNTLTGIGCRERYFRWGTMMRRMTTAMLTARNTAFSPTYWGFVTGDSSFVRTLVDFTPFHRVKNN